MFKEVIQSNLFARTTKLKTKFYKEILPLVKVLDKTRCAWEILQKGNWNNYTGDIECKLKERQV